MPSQAVSFRLEFPSRRQLQSAVDPSSNAFQLRVRAQVAASLTPPLPEANVLVSSTSVARVLEVSIIGFESRDVTPAQVVADTTSSRFLAAISNGLGSTVNMKVSPAIAVRFTSVPSPPPASPPAPPSVPLGGDVALSQSGSSSVLGAPIWMIVAVVLVLCVAIGFIVAYCLGKRAAAMKKTRTVQVGRPALRRQVSPEDARERAAATAASADDFASPQGDVAVTGLPVEDVRLLELGMAVERTMELARQQSGETSNGAKHGAKHTGIAASDIALRLDDAQAAIDDVRESLSPRSPRVGTALPSRVLERRQSMPRSPRSPREPVDTRIHATADLGV